MPNNLKTQNSSQSKSLDLLGGVLSTLCLVHCLSLPLIAVLAPTLRHFFESEWVHRSLLFLLVPIAFLALGQNRTSHRKNHPLLLGVIGVSLLLTPVLASLGEGTAETIFTFTGSFFLILAHFYNYKARNELSHLPKDKDC